MIYKSSLNTLFIDFKKVFLLIDFIFFIFIQIKVCMSEIEKIELRVWLIKG